MVEITDVVFRSTESISLVEDQPGSVIQPFHDAIIDRHTEVVEDLLFVSSHHPGKNTYRLEPRVGGPPKPSFEVPPGPASVGVVPEMTEQLLEQVGAIDLEVELFEFTETKGLALGEVPGILEPDESRPVHQGLVRQPPLADLISSNLIDSFHQMTHDMKLAEGQHGLGRLRLDDVNIRLPHVTANALQRSGFLRAKEFEESFECLLGASLTAPHQPLAFEVIDVGDVDMSTLSGYLIDPDLGQLPEVAMGKPVGDRLIDRGGHRPPRTTKQPGDLFPGQGACPGRQCDHQCSVMRRLPLTRGIASTWTPPQ